MRRAHERPDREQLAVRSSIRWPITECSRIIRDSDSDSGPGLLEHPRRDAELADVVQPRGEHDHPCERPTEVELLHESLGEPRRSLHVRRHVGRTLRGEVQQASNCIVLRVE